MAGCSVVTEVNAVSAMTTFAALPEDLLYGIPLYFDYDVINLRVFLYRISRPLLRCSRASVTRSHQEGTLARRHPN